MRHFRLFLVAAALVLALAAPAQAQTLRAADKLDVVVGKSVILDTDFNVKRVSMGSETVADIMLLSPRQLYISGKEPGATNLTLWNAADTVAKVYDIEVMPDVAALKTMLHQIMPQETDIRVIPTRGGITLSGTLSSTASVTSAVELAQSYTKDPVVNLMQVGGVHQVMLEVKVAEVQRTALNKLGANFMYFRDGEFAYSFLNNLVQLDNKDGQVQINPLPPEKGIAQPGLVQVSPEVTGMFRFIDGGGVWTGFLQALKQEGLVRVLAEPTLIALSGQEAEFLAGGEIPVPIPQGLGTVAIEYKEYGVGLKFKPSVIDNRHISMEVEPEVSELDFSNAINISGFTIPALTTRKASTTVELADGQSFAIAGLLKDSVRNVIDKYPGLGDIPVLGALFSSKEFLQNETELIIVITPRLAKPLNMAAQSLPTDRYVNPTEKEFYWLGKLHGGTRESAKIWRHGANPGPGQSRGGMQGDFGHTLPQH